MSWRDTLLRRIPIGRHQAPYLEPSDLRTLLQEMPDEDWSKFEELFYGRIRHRVLADVAREGWPRVLIDGAEVQTTGDGVERWYGAGHARWQILDFIGAEGRMHSERDRNWLEIEVMGGGAMCMDYLVDTCWATRVAEVGTNFTEGQEFRTIGGCTFKIFSTPQLATDDIKLTDPNQNTMLICPGAYGAWTINALAGDIDQLSVHTTGRVNTSVTSFTISNGGSSRIDIEDLTVTGNATFSGGNINWHESRIGGSVLGGAVGVGFFDCDLNIVNPASAVAGWYFVGGIIRSSTTIASSNGTVVFSGVDMQGADIRCHTLTMAACFIGGAVNSGANALELNGTGRVNVSVTITTTGLTGPTILFSGGGGNWQGSVTATCEQNNVNGFIGTAAGDKSNIHVTLVLPMDGNVATHLFHTTAEFVDSRFTMTPHCLNYSRLTGSGNYIDSTCGTFPAASVADRPLAGPITTYYSTARHTFIPDAAPGVVVVAGDTQGGVLHSGPSGETATQLKVDAETAPGAAGLPITVSYWDTDDLDTAAVKTTIATLTLSSEKSAKTSTMTTAAIPAERLITMDVGTIVGSPADVTSQLTTKVPLLA